jgi:peptidoglycan/LPS O-acetylase OafA/YrhL
VSVDCGGIVTGQRESYTTLPRRLPSLDGIRGVAILLVMLSHAEMTEGMPTIEWVARLGDFGVKVFFVLSGFLITTLLVNERRRSGRIALGRFVIRRAFRIFPAAYVFIVCILAAAALGWVTLRPGDALHAFTYTMNDAVAPGWWLGHLWSLSIEEQFYVAWPLVLWLFRPRSAAYVAMATIVVVPVMRAGIIMWFPGLEEGIERGFISAVDGFAGGGLLAILRHRLERHDLYMRVLRARWVMALVPMALILNLFEHHPIAFYVVLQPMIYLMLALCLHRSQIAPDGAVGQMLNWRPLAWLGSISYSLYLWQQPFLAPSGHGLLRSLPVACLLAVLCAWVSFHLVERPFLRLRERWFAAPSYAERLAPPVASSGQGAV